MKILLIHNLYQSSSPSGEDIVFRNEHTLLQQFGMQVEIYTRHNDELKDIPIFKLPFLTSYPRKTLNEFKDILKKEKPDIAHFHNIYYLISPFAYYIVQEYGIPVIQTLHNFRFFCLNGLLFRNGRICTDCIGSLPWKGIVFKCFRTYSINNLCQKSYPHLIYTNLYQNCKK